MPNTSENSNRIVLKTEHNHKINNNKILKINDGNENNAKLINANININKQYPRKLGINFKNVINKKIITERMNNFLSKDINNNSRRYKSLNANKYENDNNNTKMKHLAKNNGNKSKNQYNNHVAVNKNTENKTNLFQKILKESNNLNFKNVAVIKSKLPRLKVNKTGLNIK